MNIDIVKKEQAGIPEYHLTLPEVSVRVVLNETKAQEILNVIKDCLEDFSQWQQHSPNSTSRILSPEYNLPYIPEILFGSIGLENLEAVIQERIFGVENAISDLEDSRNYAALMFRAFFESGSAKLRQLHDFLDKERPEAGEDQPGVDIKKETAVIVSILKEIADYPIDSRSSIKLTDKNIPTLYAKRINIGDSYSPSYVHIKAGSYEARLYGRDEDFLTDNLYLLGS